MVTKASFAYPSARLSEQEARVRLELYAQALADIPASILSAAFMEAVKTIKFFPSIAELRVLAADETLRRKWAQRAPVEVGAPPAEQLISAEERDKVAAMMSGLVKRMQGAT